MFKKKLYRNTQQYEVLRCSVVNSCTVLPLKTQKTRKTALSERSTKVHKIYRLGVSRTTGKPSKTRDSIGNTKCMDTMVHE